MEIERRWDNCIHLTPETFKDFWRRRLEKKRDILVICGLGWDPRMTNLLSSLKEFGGSGVRHLHLIKYRPSPSFVSPHQELIDTNYQELERIINYWMEKEEIDIITRKEDNRYYIGDESISSFYKKFDISKYQDILVDVSALPKSLYFTLLYILVKKCDEKNPAINLHIIACQDVEFDDQIKESVDDTRFLKGFKSTINLSTRQKVPLIWAPVLTGKSSHVLKKLFDLLQPNDIYPVLPFPSRNPRSDDDLLLEYRSIFVDEWHLNPMNIIYAAEDDPLDIYRSLLNLHHQQSEALEPLGGIRMAFSCLSSKISSLGAFMAAFEKKVAVAHAIGRHSFSNINDVKKYWSQDYSNRFKNNLHSIWLTGDPYE